jgi:putative aldouronate transport system permease protein
MRDSFGDKMFLGTVHLLLSILLLLSVAPLLNIIAVSLSSSTAIETGRVFLWPVEINFDSYLLLIHGTRITDSLFNSLYLTSVGVLLCMICTICTAYPLSKSYFIGRRFFSLAFVFSMLFTGGLIPTYMVIKTLGLLDSYFAIWLPSLISTFNVLIMKSYFENIPKEIEEAARMDGCGEFRMIVRIMLPLSLPMIATLALFYGVGFWNAFMSVLIYIHSSEKYTLTVLVQQMIQSQSLLQEQMQMDSIQQKVPESIKSAAIIVMVLPMLVVYPFVQKYFVKGVMIGSIKG